ncbi:hypothetical protein [Pseudomonas sp. NA-150]|uniref:hypothetical protein n=1 Tax=Pseudomonas sp. NA-150 TaxID=3367525 RepID=UPI0037C9D67D
MYRKKLLIIGAGNLCLQILQILAPRNTFQFCVGSRDLEKTTRMCNLIRLGALQLGVNCSISALEINLDDIDRTAETLAATKPDLIVNCASLQSWRIITQLPKAHFEALDQAQFGPWLPMHLAPAYNLMQAIAKSGLRRSGVAVINAAFPDAVNAVLGKVNLAPDIGIGNVANLIPATRMAIAKLGSVLPEQVQVKLVAQHYFSHYVPRAGLPPQAHYNLTYRVNGDDWTGKLQDAHIFHLVRTEFRRLGGVDGQFLTAASAVSVISNIFSMDEVEVHAPGPHGLPGGYPVKLGMGLVVLALPNGFSRADAIALNELGQCQDGIESIKPNGSVQFESKQTSIMKAQLRFDMPFMRLNDVHQWADELGQKYKSYAEKARQGYPVWR